MSSAPEPGLIDRVVGVRRRIVAVGVGLAIVVSATGAVIVIDQVDRIIRSSELSILQSAADDYQQAVGSGGLANGPRPSSGEFVEVLNAAGQVELDTFPAGADTTVHGLGLGDLTQRSIGGSDYFQVSVPLSGQGGQWTVTIAREAGPIEDIRDSVVLLLSITLVIVDVGFAVGSWFLAAAVLRQVTRLRLSAERIAASGSRELLPVPGANDEISALATTLNALILRLRRTAERERQLVSDASHELRTPLAILQAQLELARAQDATIAEYARDLKDAERTVRRLSQIAASLLELSRVEAASVPGSATLAELGEELGESIDRARLRVGARDIEVEYVEVLDRAELGDRVAIDAVEFGRLLDNLLANSLAAMGPRGSIGVELRAADGQVQLVVDDTAGGMPSEFVDLALDRFSRPPGGHSDGGAGLGLAIVRRLVELGGGAIELRNRPDDGLTVLVSFPISTGN